MTLRPRRVGVNGTSTYDVFHAPSRDGTASATEGSVSLKLRSSTRFLTRESRPCAYRKCYPVRMPLKSATYKNPKMEASPVRRLECNNVALR